MTAPRRRPLTDREEQALDLLLDALDQQAQPGPWADCEPAVPVETWRTRLRTMFPKHRNARQTVRRTMRGLDRKSTRLNSSHLGSSYAVFCWKKKQLRWSGTSFGPPLAIGLSMLSRILHTPLAF